MPIIKISKGALLNSAEQCGATLEFKRPHVREIGDLNWVKPRRMYFRLRNRLRSRKRKEGGLYEQTHT